MAASSPGASAYSNVSPSQIQANWTNGGGLGPTYHAILSTGASPSTNNFAGNSTTDSSSLNALFTGLQPNTSYFVDVNATDLLGPSAYTALGSTVTWANFPGTGLFSGITTSQITANWTAAGNPSGTKYTIQISTLSNFGVLISSTSTSDLTNTFSNLIPNTVYFARVQAINFAGVATTFTNLGSATTLAAPPTASPASNVQSNQATANWGANGNPASTSYIVQASTDPAFGGTPQTISTTSLTGTFTGLSASTQYFMQVQAVNQGAIKTTFTGLPSVTTLQNPPVAPGAASFGNSTINQIQANWTANGNAAGTNYNAILSTASSPSTNNASGNISINTTNLSNTFTGLVVNQLYFVDVKATNSGGSSSFTSLGSNSTLANAPSAASPTNTGTSQITANWGANGNPAGTNYLAQISTDSLFGAGTVTTISTTSLTATFTGLSANTQYFMQVQAVNRSSVGTTFTGLPSTTTLINPPATPGAASFSGVTNNQIQANWTANGNAAGTNYNAILSTASSPSTNNASGNVSINTTNLFNLFAGLAVNQLYFVDVKASNGGGSSTFTSLGSIATLANAPIAASPNNVGTSQITANWGANGNPAGTNYLAQISTDSLFGAGTVTTISTTSLTATFIGLSANTPYFMQVQAINQGSVKTVFTALASTTTLQSAPTTPGAASFNSVTNNQIQANWTANGNAAGTNYNAILSTASSPSTNNASGNVSINTTNLFNLFAGLAVNQLYFVDVKASNAGGSSPFVSLGSIATSANAPTIASPSSVGTSQITANWGANGNPAGTNYLAQISTDSLFGAGTVTTISTTSLTATFVGLSANTPYFMQVQAVNRSSVGTPFTTLPSTTTVENTPAAPGAASFNNITNSQIQANWTANGNVAGTNYNAILSTASAPSTNNASGNVSINTTNLFNLFTGLAVNQLYFVDVKAFNTGGNSVYTSLSSIATSANAPISASPTNVSISSITANWGANGNPNGTAYNVEASTDSSFATPATLTISTTSLSATFTGLSANTQYFMHVQASNHSSVVTVFVNLPSTTTLQNAAGTPGPAGFSGVTSTQLQANWTANGNPAGTRYTAILSTAPSPSTNNANGNISINSPSLSDTFSGLAVNQLYYVEVNATTSGGASPYTSLGSVATLANAPIAASPTNVGNSQITANWTANGNPAGTNYLAQISTDSLFGVGTTTTISTTSLTATFIGLSANTPYFLQVQAVNQSSVKTVFTALASTTTLQNAPTTPGVASFSGVTATQIRANWTANGNAAGTNYNAILSTVSSPSTNNASGNISINTTNLFNLFTGLGVNRLYFVDVKANNPGGSSPFVSLGSIATSANAPTAASSSNIGTSQITANWGANGNPTGTNYLAQISTDSFFGAGTVTTISTTSLTATFTGLAANTQYFMQVQAVNQGSVKTTFTALLSATTLPNAPAAPGAASFTNVAATQIQANWTANGNAAFTNYNAILSTASSPSTNNASGNVSINTTNLFNLFTGLAVNQLYFVDVKGFNAGGSSVYTSLGSISTLANAPASASPTNPGTSQITANWGANGNSPGTSYLVQISTDPLLGANAVISISTTSLSATFTGLSANTQYFMQVQAINRSSVGTTFTPLPSATTLENPPAVPGALSLSNPTTSQIQANWTANGNPAGTHYMAILSTVSSPNTNNVSGNIQLSTTSLSVSFSNLFPNTVYYVDVKAFNTGGSSAFTSLGSLPTLANPPVAANPTNVQANQITANWNANGNPAGTSYLVQASLDSGFGSIASAVPTSALSVTFTSLASNTPYFMRVQAINQNSITTTFVSLPSTTTLQNAPAVPGPAGFSGVTTNVLQANWTSNGNVPGTTYTVILSTVASPSTNGVPSNQVGITTGTFAIFSGLSPNTFYFAEVKASNNGGSSAYTNLGSVPTLANPPVAANPTNVQANQITATWNANGNPAGTSYLAQASIDSGFSSIASAIPTTALSVTFTSLASNTPYFMRVLASNGNGQQTGFVSLPSTTTLNNPPAVPGAAGFNGVTVNQLQANWTTNGNAAGTLYTAILSTASSPSTNGLATNIVMTTTGTFVTFSGLTANTFYFVDVKATNSGGDSPYTNLGSVATLVNAPIAGNPTNVLANQITATWSANGNPAGTSYLAQASADSGFGAIAAAISTTSLTATFTSLAANTQYFMRVQAINVNGQATVFVALPSTTTLNNPPAIPGAAGFSGVLTNQLQANWTANGNLAGTLYTAILSTATSPSINGLSSNQVLTTTSTFVVFSGLSPNTVYFVEIKATNSNGSSPYTNDGSVPTQANAPIAANPTNVQTGQITANWGTNGNPAGTSYLAQASADSGFGSIAAALTVTQSSATLSGLTANTLYFMRVQAINIIGQSTVFVALPSTTTLNNPPATPGAAGFSGVLNNQLQANWTANGNLAGTLYTAILSTATSASTNGISSNQIITTTSTFALFSGLLPNTVYFVEIKATNSNGSSPYTNDGSVPTLANVPLAANPTDVQTGQITANWGTNGNPAGTTYLAQASVDSGFGSIAAALTVTQSSATLIGLAANTPYFMRVQAININGQSTVFVALPSTTTLNNPPATPGAAGFSGVLNNQLQANWTTNGNLAGTIYTAILSTGNSPSTNGISGNQVVTTTATFITFTGLLPNTVYFVEIKATNSNGSSPYISEGSVPTLANVPLAANPTNVQIGQITANWGTNGNPSGTSYLVQASIDSGFSSIASAILSTTSSGTLTGLAANTPYFMHVQAININGLATIFTTLPSTTTLANPPAIPGAAGFSGVTNNLLQVNWTTNGNSASTVYTAILSSAPSPSTNGLAGNQTNTTTSTSITFTGLLPNTVYFVDVKASNSNGSSAYASMGSIPTLANVPLSANPTNIQIGQITANWGTNSNPAGTSYLAQASIDSGFTSIAAAVLTTQSSATLTGLSANTPYFMHVQAININGLATVFTVLPSTTTLANPPAIPGAAGFSNVTVNQVQANWTTNGNSPATVYTAILSSAPSPSTNGLASNQTNTTLNTAIIFNGLLPNTVYFVDVKASNSNGSSAYASMGSIPTLANVPLAANPTNIQIGQITANWTVNGNPSGTSYLIQASVDSGFSSIAAAVLTTQSSATLTGLSANTPYFMHVQAININGLATAFTALPSTTTLANPPAIPGAAGFSNVAVNQVQANWTANGNSPATVYTAILSSAPSPSTNGLAGNQTSTTSNTATTFSGLLPNTVYFVEIKASNSNGSSPYTSDGSVPTLANAPTAANPTNVQIAQITANWGANNNPAGTSYLVQASVDSGFASIASAVLSTGSSATLTGLSANTPYFLHVQAININGLATTFTALPSTTTLANPPAIPGAAGFSNVAVNQVQANWTANGNSPATVYTAILSSAPSPSTNGLAGNQSNTTTSTSILFSGLLPNTIYFIEIKATNSNGSSPYTSDGSVPTLANVPTAANPTTVQIGQITANWGTNGNPAGTSYLAQASVDSGFTSIAAAVLTTQSSATLTGLSANTPYFMHVQAININGLATAFTALPSTTTLANPPAIPGAAGFSNVAVNQLQVNWTTNGNSPATVYTAIVSSAPSPSTNGLSNNQTNSTSNTAITFSGLFPNTVYYVDVKASNSNGSSAYASMGSIPTLANTPLAANPTNIQIGQITANWVTNGNPVGTSYLAQASIDSGFSSIAAAVLTTQSSATLTGLSANTPYFMHVQAININGLATTFTPLPSTTTLANPPAIPGAAGFSNITTSQIQTNWTANGNSPATIYTAILSSAPSPSTNGLTGNQTNTTTSTSITFSGLLPNTIYFVDVKASNSNGNSVYASMGSIPTLANVPTANNPTNVLANQITANWGTNGNPAGTSYVVQASIDSGFSSIAAAVLTTQSSATLTGLSANTPFFMHVQAIDSNGRPTAFIALPSTTTLTNPPGVPGAAGFNNVTTSQLQANWVPNGNLPGTVYTAILSSAPFPSTNGLGNNQTNTTTNTATTFAGLSPNTLYYVDVKAVNSNGTSPFSNIGSIPTLANIPTSSAASNIQTNQITANWGANGNPDGTSYLAQASIDPAFNSIAAAISTTSLSTTFTGLSANTVFYMHVQAINGNGQPTIFVALPSTTTLANPPAIPGVAGFNNITTSQLQANWTANGNSAATLYTAILSSASSPSTNGLSGNQVKTTTGTLALFSGLAPNTLYFIEVNATNSNGISAYSSQESEPTLAKDPIAAIPTTILTNQITANWNTNGNPAGTSYLAQASIDPGFSSIASALLTTASSATLTGLSANTSFYMHVQAINSNGQQTAFIPLPLAATLANPPAIPGAAGFSNVTTSQLQANWTTNGNLANTLYTIVLSSAPSPSTNGLAGNQTKTTLATFITFSTLSPNTVYFVDVKATNSNGSSAYSGLGSIPTLANNPVAGSPTTILTNQITANWNTNGNPAGTSYLAQASIDPGFGSVAAAVLTTFSSATLSGLSANTTFYMQVQAINSVGQQTSFVPLPSAATLTNPPGIPGAAGFSNVTTTQLQSNWTTNGNLAGTVYTAILSSAPSPSANGLNTNQVRTTTGTFAVFAGLAPNTFYYIEVNASNSNGISQYSNMGSISTLANAPTSGNPTNVQISQITANWGTNGNPPVTLYLAQASNDPGFGSIASSILTTLSSATLTGLSSNTTFYMRVQAINGIGQSTTFITLPSTKTLVNPPAVPGAAGFSNVTTTQLQSSWTPNGNPADTLYTAILSTAPAPSTNGVSGNVISTTTGTSTTFVGLSTNTFYYVDVNASNSNGISQYSSMGSVPTLASQPIVSSPTAVLANQITANWGINGNPPSTSYLAQASNDPAFGSIASAIVTNLPSATFAGLSADTMFYMRVQALNGNGLKTAFTLLPSTMTLDNPAAPPGAAGLTNVTATQIQANWTTNGNPVGTLYTVILSTAPSPSTNGYGGNISSTTLNTSSLFTGLIPNTFYYAEVKALNTNGSSLFTSLGSLPTLANSPSVGGPSNIGANQITANWGINSNPPDTLYLVQIGLSTGSFISTEPTLLSSFTFTNLSPNTTYFMQVQAINKAAQFTPFTILPAAATVIGPPSTSVLSASQITDAAITWQWTIVTAANQYFIVSETGASARPGCDAALPPSQINCQELSLPVNTPISRRVIAVNASGSSTSTLVTVYTLAHQPANLSAESIASNAITITWDANGNPPNTTYQANIFQTGVAPRQITVTTPQATFDGLAGATTYFFSVQAFNGAGVAAPAGDVLSVATLPQTATSGQICPASAGAFSFNGPKGRVSAYIPQGAFANCVALNITVPGSGSFPTASSSGTPLQGTGIGIQLQVVNNPSLQPLQPITLTVPFTLSDIPNGTRNQLVLARYDTTHKSWVMLPSTVDPVDNFVTAPTDHLSLYQVMVAVPGSGLSNVRVYPNPFRPSLGELRVNFVNLPTDASLQIFTLRGERVQSMQATPTGTATWDGRNQSGQSVASGVYFVVIKSGGDKTIVKVAVQR